MAKKKIVMELAPLFGPNSKEAKDKLMDKDEEKDPSVVSMYEKGVKEAEDTYPSKKPKFPKVMKEEKDKLEKLEKERNSAWEALKKNPKDKDLRKKYFAVDQAIINCLNSMGDDVVQEKYPEPKDYPAQSDKYPATQKKVVAEAVPPSQRERFIKQQEQDLQRMMAQEEELQRRLEQAKAEREALNKKLALGLPPEQKAQAELDQAKFGMMRRESKNEALTITKAQLKEAVKKGIQINERKKFIYETVKNQISEQIEVKNLIESKLNEGPLSNVFAGAKSAASAATSGLKNTMGNVSAAFKQGSAEQQQKSQQQQLLKQKQEQQKQVQKAVADAIKNVSSSRNKFNQEILKNTNLVNQYHDSVVNLNAVIDQAKRVMSEPEAQKLDAERTMALGQLYQDLDSERKGINIFLKDLENKIGKDKLLMTRTKAAISNAEKQGSFMASGGKGPSRAGLRGTRSGGGSGLL